jgi:hypothetical protein
MSLFSLSVELRSPAATACILMRESVPRPGPFSLLAQRKGTKRKGARMSHPLARVPCAPRSLGGLAIGHPGLAPDARRPCRAPAGFFPPALRCSVRHTGVWKTTQDRANRLRRYFLCGILSRYAHAFEDCSRRTHCGEGPWMAARRIPVAMHWGLCLFRPVGAPEHRKALAPSPQGRARDRARWPSAQGCAVGQPPAKAEKRRNQCASGCPFFRFLSLGKQRKEHVARGRNPASRILSPQATRLYDLRVERRGSV